MSAHHGNTLKIAEAISRASGAKIIKPAEIDNENLADYDLIGLESGIYNRRHHQSLFDLIARLPIQNRKKAFVFSTNTFGLAALHDPLKLKLAEKGFEVVGEFTCRGFINHGFLKYLFGGLSQGRPNQGDLRAAEGFAERL